MLQEKDNNRQIIGSMKFTGERKYVDKYMMLYYYINTWGP